MEAINMANNSVVQIQKSLDEEIISKISSLQEKGLEIPASYSPQNALKSAFFELSNSNGTNLLEQSAHSPEMKISISNALLDMVIQGLSPAKNQCYFIKYGNSVQLQRSYFGTMAVLKRVTGGADIEPVVVHEGDDFEVDMDGPNLVVTKHKTSFFNLDNDIIGAYVVIKLPSGKEITTVMTKKQIDQSWSKTRNAKNQKEFPDEMAKRTVINRAAKTLINTSNDDDLFVQAAKQTLKNEFEESNVKQVEPVSVKELETKLQSKLNVAPVEEPEETIIDFEETEIEEIIPENEEPEVVQTELIEIPQKEEFIPDFSREEGIIDEFNDTISPF